MPEDVKQDVNTEEPSASEEVTQEVVSEEAVADPQPEVEAQPEPTPEPASKQEDVDEFGVPWKNRAMEKERKLGDLVDRLPELIGEAVAKNTGQPKYTRQQLEQYAQQADDPSHVAWAHEEIRKIDKEDQTKTVRDEIARFKKEQDNLQKRQQSNAYTVQKFPDAFLKGVNGQFVVDKSGDPIPNLQSPMGQTMANYLADEGLQSRPDKFFIASKLAYADKVAATQGQAMQKEQKLKEEVGSLQRKTMVEGGGKSSPQAAPAHQQALDRLRETGKIDDAKVALDALLKAKQKE